MLLETVGLLNDLIPLWKDATPVVRDLLGVYPLRTISKAEIDQLKENLDNGRPVIDSLCNISVNFRFKRDILTEFMKLETAVVRENAKPILAFLLANAIAFAFNLPGEELNYDLELLIRCFHSVTGPLDTSMLKVMDFIVMVVVRRTIQAAVVPFHDSLVSVFCSHVNYFHFDDPNVVQLLVEVLHMSFSNGNEESARTVLTTLKDVIGNCDCSQPVNAYLLPILEAWIHSIDKVVYGLVGILGTLKPTESILRLYCGIPDAIYHFVEENRAIFASIDVQKSDVQLPYEEYTANAIEEEVEEPPSQTPLKAVVDATLEAGNFRIEEFYPEGMLPMVDTVMLAFENVKQALLKKFLESFAGLVRKHRDNDLLLVFVYFLSKIKHIKKVDVWAVETLVTPYFFSPSLTIFNAKLTPRTNFFRATIISVICFYGHHLVPMLLDRFVSFPYLFPEILMRVARCFPGFVDIKVMFDEHVFQDLMRCETALRAISIRVPEDVRSVVASARLKIFQFAFALFELTDVPSNCYESPFFSTSFLSAFCEPEMKALMFAQLQKILAKDTTSEQTVQFLMNSVKLNILSGKDELAVHLLTCLGECLTLNKTLLAGAPDLFKTSLEYAKSLTVFQAILRFCVQLAHHCQSFSLDVLDMTRIAAFLNSSESFDDNCISYLVCLLSESSSHRFGSVFLIQQPALAIVLMSVFSAHGKSKEFLAYVKSLLAFSLCNCWALHSGAFDLLLLDMIHHHPDSFVFRGCPITGNAELELDDLVSLFNTISSVCSSLNVANRLMRILLPVHQKDVECAISDRGIPDTSVFSVRGAKFSSVVGSLTSKLSTLYASKRPDFAFACRQIVGDAPLRFGDFSKNFTFCFSIFADGQISTMLNSKVVLFTVEDDMGLIAEVFLRRSSLLMSFCTEQSLVTFVLVEEFPTSEYTTVVLEMSGGDDKITKVRSHVNGKYPQSGNVRLLSLDPDKLVKFYFGQPLPDAPEIEMEKLAIGFRMNGACIVNRILTYDERREVTVSIDNVTDVFYKLPIERTDFPMANIGQVLRYELPVDVVIPVFLFLEKYQVAEQEVLIDFIVMIFRTKLTNYFYVISKLLMENGPSVLRFSIYQKMASLVDVCENVDHYCDLYESILCNIDIWKHSPHLDRIVSHWNQVLYSTCPSYFEKPSFFQKVTRIMREIPEPSTAFDLVMNLVRNRMRHTFSMTECESVLTSISRGVCDIRLLDIITSFELDLDEEMAKLLVKTPHNGRCEDVIRIIKVLKMCKNWRVHYPVFVYRIDTSIDETLLASHYTELPELIFCVVWIKLLKKELLDSPALQKLSSELPKASLIFVIMVLLEASRAPSNMDDIMVFISLYLDQWKDPDLLWTMLDLIDVFGSRDMACLLYKLYFDRVVVVSQQTHFHGMLLGCFRALFVKRLMYTHQPELCEDETEEDTNQWSSVQDLLRIVQHEYVYTVCPKEKSSFSRYERSLFDFGLCLLGEKRVNTPLLGYVAKHLDYCSENRGDFFNPTFVDQILDPIRDHSIGTMEQLRNFFENVCSSTRAAPTSDEIEYEQQKRRGHQRSEEQWKGILLDFMHKETVWGLSDYVWARDFHISPNFMSFRLKRSVGYATEKEVPPPVDTKHSICQFECVRVKISSERKCTLVGYNGFMSLVFEHKIKTVNYSQIAHILCRDRKNQATCLEFFLTNGYSLLLDFAPTNSQKVLQALKVPKSKSSIFQIKESFQDLVTNSNILERYNERKMSATAFLCWLNMLAGRSYHDVSLYPVFPYLGFDAPRDLSLPVPCFDEPARSRLEARLSDVGFTFTAFPSNHMILAYFLVRHEPFSTLHFHLHGNRFEDSDRQFLSTEAFAKALKASDQNIESCPEFFTMPEAFLSLNPKCELPNLDVGNYKDVYNFVSHLLLTLEECDLCKWIDLIFGVDLNNPDKLNVFDFETLQTRKWTELSGLFAQLGTLPPQIFSKPVTERQQSTPLDPVVKSQTLGPQITSPFLLGSLVYFVNERSTLVAVKNGKLEDQKVELSRCLCSNSNFALFQKPKSGLFLFGKDGKIKDVTLHKRYDIFVLSDPDLLVCATQDGCVQFLSVSDLQEIQPGTYVFSDTLKCLCMSSQLGVLVYGTISGVVGVISLKNRRFVNSCDIGFTPDRVTISANVGCIVVTSKKQIAILTINGFHIKTIDLEFKVCEVCQFEREGVDYVCVSDAFGHLWIFDAFHPEKIRSLCYCGNRPLLMLESANAEIVAVSDDGILYTVKL